MGASTGGKFVGGKGDSPASFSFFLGEWLTADNYMRGELSPPVEGGKVV